MQMPHLVIAAGALGGFLVACSDPPQPEREFSCDTASRCPTVVRDADDVAACNGELEGTCHDSYKAKQLCILDKEECTPDGKQNQEKLSQDCASAYKAYDACKGSN